MENVLGQSAISNLQSEIHLLSFPPPNDQKAEDHGDGAKLDHMSAIAQPGLDLVKQAAQPVAREYRQSAECWILRGGMNR
jgi:hypothetical protein